MSHGQRQHWYSGQHFVLAQVTKFFFDMHHFIDDSKTRFFKSFFKSINQENGVIYDQMLFPSGMIASTVQ